MDPLAIILVTSGTRGDRLLFRYPTSPNNKPDGTQANFPKPRNPYAVEIREDIAANKFTSFTDDDQDERNFLDEDRFNDQILSNLLAVKSDLCGQNFNVKVDNVRFIGFPMTVERGVSRRNKTGHQIISFNVVIAVKSNLMQSVMNCYFDLIKQLTVALQYEEKRRVFLSQQAKIMLSIHDDVAAMTEDTMENPFELILAKSSLAKDLKLVHDSLCESGIVDIHVNGWIAVSFCLPHKIHILPWSSSVLSILPEKIQQCLKGLRPYHGILLLQESFKQPLDCTLALTRLISVASPWKNLNTLALEADLNLSQVFHLVSHLVYWAKVTIIYPLCETNTYILSPSANTQLGSDLSSNFAKMFDRKLLAEELSDFSLPVQLREVIGILDHPKEQEEKKQIVLWMLKHKLIMQLHTYVIFSPHTPLRKKRIHEELGKNPQVMPILLEEGVSDSSKDLSSGMTRTPSVSDVASVNSDESTSLSASLVQSNYLSKSPASDTSQISEEMRGFMREGSTLLSKEEWDCVLAVQASKSTEDLKLFQKLLPYFNGKHHVEEIMYFENLNRSQLMIMLDKFHEVLTTFQVQDTTTSLGMDFSKQLHI